MTVSDLIFRLLEFNSGDEVRICGGFSLDSTDIRVSDTPNVVMLGTGIRGLKEIIDDLTDCSHELEFIAEDLENEDSGHLYDTDDLDSKISNLNNLIEELTDLSEV